MHERDDAIDVADDRDETRPVDEATVNGDDPAGHEVAVATPVDDDDEREPADVEEEEPLGSGGNGRFITAIGAAVLLVGMFLSWYEVVRSNGYTVETTGWQTFTKLRFLLLFGSVACLVSALLRQTRAIALGRLAVGLVASALVIRRIVSPPDLPGATITAQLGIYVALLGALGIAFGGLLGLGGPEEDDVEDDDMLDRPGEPVAALGEGSEPEPVDAEVVEDESAGDVRG